MAQLVMHSNCVDPHNYFLSKLYSLKKSHALKAILATQLLLAIRTEECQLILDEQESGENKLLKSSKNYHKVYELF